VRLLFSFTLFISAALLFLVQPMVGKILLPMAGGTPGVWNTCMVFFQAGLLLAYGYAHIATVRRGPRAWSNVHVGLLLIPLLALAGATLWKGHPLHAFKEMAPAGQEYPFFNIMALLAALIGIPFFFLATTAPLLQRWFADTDDPAAKDPYFLYAASNLGSFVGLILYPTVFEKYLTLRQQAWIWSIGFVGWTGLIWLCANALRKSPTAAMTVVAKQFNTSLTWAQRLRWVGLAAVPSSLMLSVTSYATTDLAPIPLFLIVPLSIYLLTFVIAFGLRAPWIFKTASFISPMLLLVFIFLRGTGQEEGIIDSIAKLFHSKQLKEDKSLPDSILIWWRVGYHVLVFTIVALGCHFELARSRPPARQLTEFYFWLSLGGVLGGLFNALIAPIIFVQHTEYIVGLLAACFLVAPGTSTTDVPSWRKSLDIVAALVFGIAMYFTLRHVNWALDKFPLKPINDWLSDHQFKVLIPLVQAWFCFAAAAVICLPLAPRWLDVTAAIGLSVIVITLIGYFELGGETWPMSWLRGKLQDRDKLYWLERIKVIACYGLPAVICFAFVERPLRFGLSVVGLFLISVAARSSDAEHFLDVRSFFGTLSVQVESQKWVNDEERTFHKLVHGTTTHGLQVYDPPEDVPLTYYHPQGPVGDIFRMTPAGKSSRPLGFVGLGTGSLTGHAKPGQSVTIYEIDPVVRRIAEDPKYFSYLTQARQRGVDINIVMGDARLRLEDAPDGQLAVLAVDAFSSDSIPVHLLTRDAVEMYFRKLAPDGILALHVSNRYLDLDRVVARIAEELGKPAFQWSDYERDNPAPGKYNSDWIVLANRVEDLGELTKIRKNESDERPRWEPLKVDWEKPAPLWTDDYSNVLGVFSLPQSE